MRLQIQWCFFNDNRYQIRGTLRATTSSMRLTIKDHNINLDKVRRLENMGYVVELIILGGMDNDDSTNSLQDLCNDLYVRSDCDGEII